MLKTRNKRLKTDYQPQNSSHQPFREPQVSIPKRRSTLSNDRQSYITRTLNSINHEVKYDRLTEEQIQAEREQLKLKVREINGIMNGMLGRELERRIEGSRVSKKATIGSEMGIDYTTLCKEGILNASKIQTLQQELQENLTKLSGLNNVDSKLDYGRRVAQAQIKIKQLKQQLGRIKKNKLLREKQIMKGSIKQNQHLHTLQQEYINYTRKAELILTKLQVNQQELVDSQFSLEKQRDYYDELKTEYTVYEETEGKIGSQQEQLMLLYNTRQKKVDLFARRNQKQEENKKKKYYNLLLEYQDAKTKEKQLDEKITYAEKKNQITLLELARILEHLKAINLSKPSRHSLQYYKPSQEEYQNVFELTQANPARQFSSQKSHHSQANPNRLIIQNKLNKINANRRLIRQWNLQGSIIHQNLSPPKPLQSIDQLQNSEQSIKNKTGTAISGQRYRKTNLSKQIRHFKTQTSQLLQQSIASQNLQEEYEQDFQI